MVCRPVTLPSGLPTAGLSTGLTLGERPPAGTRAGSPAPARRSLLHRPHPREPRRPGGYRAAPPAWLRVVTSSKRTTRIFLFQRAPATVSSPVSATKAAAEPGLKFSIPSTSPRAKRSCGASVKLNRHLTTNTVRLTDTSHHNLHNFPPLDTS